MNTAFRKTGSFALSLALVLGSFAPIVTPVAQAVAPVSGPGYLIVGTATTNGLMVTVSGTASADKFTGQANDQHISVDWDNGIGWQEFVGQSGLVYTDSSVNGVIASSTYATSTTYSAPGSHTIRVSIHHANAAGNEGVFSTVTFTVNISYQCSDGVDNDTDGLMDYPADPGCSSATDDDEFNVVVVNTPPTANPLSISTNENIATSSTLTGADADSNPITFGIVTGPSNGLITLFNAVSGLFTYTPNTNYFGADSFTFKTNDGTASSTSAATVSITVNQVIVQVPGCTDNTALNYNPAATQDDESCTYNTAPVANALSITTAQDTATSSAVTASDVNNDTLTFGVVNGPSNGTLTSFSTTTGAFTYSPNAGYFGADAFTFTANDGIASSSVATTSITVTQAPAAPVLGCTNASATNYNASATQDNGSCTFPSNGGGGGGGGGGNGPVSTIVYINGGEVLGAQTEVCDEYLTSYIKAGANNDSAQVLKLQSFLNNFEAYNLALTGQYDAASLAAVHSFQTKYAAQILTPWGATHSTGYVYYTTKKTINEIYCKFTKQFPLNSAQLAEIARIKAAGEAYTTPAGIGAGSAGVGSGVVLPSTKPQDQTDENAVIGSTNTGAASQTAGAANAVPAATSTGNWWTNFWGWVFGTN